MVRGHWLLFCPSARHGFYFQGHFTVTDGCCGSILPLAPHLSGWRRKGKTLSLEILLMALHINLLKLVPEPQRELGNVARPGITYKSEETIVVRLSHSLFYLSGVKEALELLRKLKLLSPEKYTQENFTCNLRESKDSVKTRCLRTPN